MNTHARIIRLSTACALLVWGAGCPSFSSMQTARTVETGKTEHAIGVQAVRFAGDVETTDSEGNTTTENGSVTLPQFEYGLRYGLSDKSDVGFKFYFMGLQGDYKYRFLTGGTLEGAVAPGLSAFTFSTGDASLTVLYIHLPLLFDYVASESTRFMFGPKVIHQMVFGSNDGETETVDQTFYGGAVALDLLLGETFRLRPELNMFKSSEVDEVTFFQAGIGFAF